MTRAKKPNWLRETSLKTLAQMEKGPVFRPGLSHFY
jgi:hypothetical protein